MLRLIRFLFTLALIVLLAGFVLSWRFRGRTPAELACRLADNARCSELAGRGELLIRGAEHRLHLIPPPQAARREPAWHSMGHTPPAVRVEPNRPPMDRHSNEERRALDRIVAEHGSR